MLWARPDVQELQRPSQDRRVEEAGGAWLWAQAGLRVAGWGFSSTAANTVLFPHLRTIQVRMKTLQKIQYNSLEGNCEGVDIGVSCKAQHSVSEV